MNVSKIQMLQCRKPCFKGVQESQTYPRDNCNVTVGELKSELQQLSRDIKQMFRKQDERIGEGLKTTINANYFGDFDTYNSAQKQIKNTFGLWG